MRFSVPILLSAASLFPLVALGANRGICGAVTNKPANQIPKNVRCRFEGELTSGKPFTTFQSSYERCRKECLVGTRCLAFSFKSTDPSVEPEASTQGTCMTYRKRIIKQGSVKKKTGVFFWNRSCFAVEAYYPFSPIDNGDFEAEPDLANWTQGNPNITIHTEGSNRSAWIRAQCGANECSGQFANRTTILNQSFFLCKGVTYNIKYELVQPLDEMIYPNNGDGDAYVTYLYLIKPSGGDKIQFGLVVYYSPSWVGFFQNGDFESVYAPDTMYGNTSVNATESGTYTLSIQSSAPVPNSLITLQIDNVVITATG